ncbi:hypothetical protein FGG08_001421 [Glutinoglossum americanum]|uniref:Uncharacterized protein n=1 Tax=Glutinoglossum americanum TaxID=1670608 RepID=A0A9P8L5A4_9PEZI|nr:hypothetical protein FGG08_001421 [Glutinoglossum americanum]
MRTPDLLHPPEPVPSAVVSGLALAVLGGHHKDSDGGSTLQRWSSLVGIITAICGNILISFALNIQRYAHIRIQRERVRNVRRSQNRKRWTSGGSSVYGATDDTDVKRNGAGGKQVQKAPRTPSDDYAHNVGEDSDGGATERDPLTESFVSARSYNSNSTMQGSSHTEKASLHSSKIYLRSPYWWAGIILMTIGEAGNFLAYGFAPASIVSPLGVVALISNCVIAPLVLKEPFRMRDFWGVVVAITGAVVVVLSAKNLETKLGPHEIWGAIARWEFETYLGVTITLMLLGMWSSGKYGERTIFIDLGLVALFGGYTALSTKGVASLLSYKFFHIVTFPVSYLLVAVLVSTALLQIKYLNRALQRFDSTQVIPTQFVLFTISVIIGSTVLYRDFEKATADRVIKFVAGCMLTFTGVYLITSDRPTSQDCVEESEADEEGAFGLVGRDGGYHDDIDVLPEGVRTEQKPSHDVIRDDGASEGDGGGGDYDEDISPSRRGPPWASNGDSASPPLRPLHSQSSRSSIPSGSSSLAENPWQTSDTDDPLATPSRPRPRLHGTSSESLPVSGLRTPTGQDQDASLTRSLSQPHQTEAPATPVTPAPRKTLSRMMPGPLSSPLSSLTAVVADELRRGADSLSSPSRKRLGHSLRVPRLSSHVTPKITRSARKTKTSHTVSQDDTVGNEETIASSSQQTTSPVVAEDPGSVNIGEGRVRKLSATLGDFIRRKRAKSGVAEREQSDDEENIR